VAYKKQELIKELLDFKDQFERFPSRKDFELKRIKPSKNAFYRAFGSPEKAIQQAERWEKGDEVPFEEPKRLSPAKKTSFQCRFCGSSVSDLNAYYNTLPQIMVLRYLDLLRKNDGGTYSDAVLDCLNVVFRNNKYMRNALYKEGFLDQFDRRFTNACPNPDEEVGSGTTGD